MLEGGRLEWRRLVSVLGPGAAGASLILGPSFLPPQFCRVVEADGAEQIKCDVEDPALVSGHLVQFSGLEACEHAGLRPIKFHSELELSSAPT